MVQRQRSGTLLVLAGFALLGCGRPGYAGGNKPVVKGEEGRPKTVAQLRKMLDMPVTLEFERGPLREVVAYLQDRYNIPIIVDRKAFQEDRKLADVLGADVELPKVVNLKLDTVLRLLLDGVDGGIQLRDGLVVIVPKERLKPERLLRRPVSTRFQQQPLTEALAELSQTAEFSIVVDVRAADKAKTPVTAVFQQVPLEEAVFVLADMAGLKPVRVGHVLYVTTKENAAVVQAERARPSDNMPKAAD